MALIVLCVLLFVIIYFACNEPRVGLRWAETAVFGTLILVPFRLIKVTPAPNDYIVGIAPPNVVLFSYDVAILAVFVAMLGRFGGRGRFGRGARSERRTVKHGAVTVQGGRQPVQGLRGASQEEAARKDGGRGGAAGRRSSGRGGQAIGMWWLVVMLAYLALMWALVWRHAGYNPELVSGLAQIAASVLAVYVGSAIGAGLRDDPREQSWFSLILLGVAIVLTISVLIQVPSALAAGDVSRVSGVYEIPSIIGKVAMMLVCLPLAGSEQPAVRKRAYATAALMVLATAPTLSRANIVGLAIILVVWALLAPSAALRRRARIVVGVGAALCIPFFAALLDRFEGDPQGGDRPALLAAGMAMVRQHWAAGTGPNLYVPIASRTHEIVFITGYPVHNTFLLAVVELGVVGAVLLLVPFLAPVVHLRAALRERATLRGRAAASVLSVAPALIVAGVVSWGLLQYPILELLCLCFGICGAWIRTPGRAPDQVSESGSGRAGTQSIRPRRGELVHSGGSRDTAAPAGTR